VSAIDELLKIPPYRTSPGQHDELFRRAVSESIRHHCAGCPPFARWYRRQGADPQAPVEDLARLPFLPVTAFKRMRLESVESGAVVRLLKSSATSLQTPSSVALDAITRDRQMRALAILMCDLIGTRRRPFIVLDAPPQGNAAGSDVELSARAAGMRGYLMMATETHYVMQPGRDGPVLDIPRLREVLRELVTRQVPVCLLAYTYMLFRHAVEPLERERLRFELPAGSFVLHFGGWKRLEAQAVSRDRFNAGVARVFTMNGAPQATIHGAMQGTTHAPPIRDIYGFTEQLGVIYPDDGFGVRLTPVYSEVIVRDPFTLRPLEPRGCAPGAPGLLQFITPLPHSYPGVSLLLDDVGRIISRDVGTRFEVQGRARGAEIRGCGDTLPERVYEVRS